MLSVSISHRTSSSLDVIGTVCFALAPTHDARRDLNKLSSNAVSSENMGSFLAIKLGYDGF